MAVQRAKNKATAKRAARRARRRGLKASVFKSKKGWKVSKTRK